MVVVECVDHGPLKRDKHNDEKKDRRGVLWHTYECEECPFVCDVPIDPTLAPRAEADTIADERNRMASEVLKLADYIEEASSTLHGWIAADLRKLVKSPIVGDRMVARAEVAERLEGFANAEELNEFEGTALNQVMGRERAAALRHAADYFHRATREAEAVDPDGGGGK